MGRWANKYVIGLTGNIATGKSVVRQMLQHLEAYTIDADSLTHRAMAPGAPAYKPILDTFGQFILDAEGNINRAMLGQIVFSNPNALARLEAIVQPVVVGAVNALVSRATQKVVVIEAIKLLEGDLGKAVDAVWVVDAVPEVQLKRLIEKRKMSEGDARQRIAAQNAQADKLAKANVIIRNNGDIGETWNQVQAAWNAIQAGMQAPAPAPVAPAPVPAPTPAPVPRPVAPAQPASVSPVTQPVQPVRVMPAPAAPAPAAVVAPTPAPVAAPPVPQVHQPSIPSTITVAIKRGMPTNADAIARFITATSGRSVDRMAIMMAFGEKSYLIAQDQTERTLAVMGWQVENLITRVDELYLANNIPTNMIVEKLVEAVEAASKDLQSEVAYFFLAENVSGDLVNTFEGSGYENTAIEQIKIPAWREAVQEVLRDNKAVRILGKKLREDRVLKPI